MSSGLPDRPHADDHNEDGAGASETRVLNIDHLHLHANDLDALRRLSESDPELARIVVDQNDKLDRREHASERFGIVAAVFLVLGLLITGSFVLINIGIILSIILLGLILICGVVVRVILTGEWSDASWFGRVIISVVSLLGGKSENIDD